MKPACNQAPRPLANSLFLQLAGSCAWRLLPLFAAISCALAWQALTAPDVLLPAAGRSTTEDWWIVKPLTGKSL